MEFTETEKEQKAPQLQQQCHPSSSIDPTSNTKNSSKDLLLSKPVSTNVIPTIGHNPTPPNSAEQIPPQRGYYNPIAQSYYSNPRDATVAFSLTQESYNYISQL